MAQSLFQRQKYQCWSYGCAVLSLCMLCLAIGATTPVRGQTAIAAPDLDPWTKSFQGLRNAQNANHSREHQLRFSQTDVDARPLSKYPVSNEHSTGKRMRKTKINPPSVTSIAIVQQNDIVDLSPTNRNHAQQIQLAIRPAVTHIEQDYQHRTVSGLKLCTPCKVVPKRPMSKRPLYQPTSSPFFISSLSSSSSASSSVISFRGRQRGNIFMCRICICSKSHCVNNLYRTIY